MAEQENRAPGALRLRSSSWHGYHQVVARFDAERQALALMEHPISQECLMLAHAGRTAFFVMELVGVSR